MRKFYTLLSREVRSYFHSPIAYIVLTFFLIVSGINFNLIVSYMNRRTIDISVQQFFFNWVLFWFPFILIFPLITMRLFAEEFKLGTIEPLTTVPVRDWQVVLSKFFGALVDFSKHNRPSRGAFRRCILGFVSDTFVAGNVLSFDWLSHVRSDEEPNHRGHYFFLRNYPVIFFRPGSVDTFGCYFHNARFAGLFLRHRTHGDILARGNRYAADRALCEHDHSDADTHLPGIPIP